MGTKKFAVVVAALSMGLIVSALAPVAHGQESAGARRFMVRYRNQVTAQEQREAIAKLGLRHRKQLSQRGLQVVELPSYADSDKAMAALRAQPEVEFVVPDQRVQMFANTNDPFFASQWSLHNSSDTDIDAPQAWDVMRDASSTVVAVIDTGVDLFHDDLEANLWTNSGEVVNGYDDDRNGYVDDVHGIDCANDDGDPSDDNGHGTHVAGTIGAVGNNGRGVAGVAWRTQIMALKMMDASGGGYYSDAIECIDYARAMKSRGVNVRVINASWGGPYDSFLLDSLRAAQNAGILTAAAAGNSANDHAFYPAYPASFALDGVVAVAATDQSGSLAYFSDYGADVEIAAPGVSILSTYPGDHYAYMSGTSMASPHVAGAAALYASQHPGATFGEIRARLLATADRTGPLGYAVQSGRLDLAALVGGTQPPPTPPAPPAPVSGDVPVFGKSIAIADTTKGKFKLTMVAKDTRIQVPELGGPDDPSYYGAELVIRGHESGEAVFVELEPEGWRSSKKGWTYKGTGGCTVVLKRGALTVKCGSGAQFPLYAAYQGSVLVDLFMGGRRFCSEFGGDVTKDFGIGFGKKPSKGAFTAKAAPAPSTCD